MARRDPVARGGREQGPTSRQEATGIEFDVIFQEFVGIRDATYEQDQVELGATPALHLFYGDDFAVDWPA